MGTDYGEWNADPEDHSPFFFRSTTTILRIYRIFSCCQETCLSFAWQLPVQCHLSVSPSRPRREYILLHAPGSPGMIYGSLQSPHPPALFRIQALFLKCKQADGL